MCELQKHDEQSKDLLFRTLPYRTSAGKIVQVKFRCLWNEEKVRTMTILQKQDNQAKGLLFRTWNSFIPHKCGKSSTSKV